MAKAVSVILNLRDNASKGLIGVANRTKGVSKEMKSATRTVVSWKNSFNKSLDSMTGKVVKFASKWGSLAVSVAGGFVVKTALSEAMDLEGYRMQLETATKDTEKAASIMKYAIDLANKTPFEGGQLVEGAAKFEAMGMSAKKWLTLTGDMAAATNKDFDQAVEALIDAQTGELERLKEFGITKAMIQQHAEDMFHDVQVVNNKGQIVDQEKFNEAMIQLMTDKYTGGMEKQATTARGLLSTITGITKSALAKIAGMNEDGSVRAGSAFDLLRNKLQLLADKFQQWQSDGTIDALADKFTELVQKALDFAENAGGKLIQALDWISQHSEGVKTALKVLGVAFAAFKIVGFIGNVVYAVHTLAEFGGMLKIVGGVARGGLLSGLT
ncbi:MAG: phage tail tape measure protein, partial [Eubacteriales bacterium]|nr:phage tail tape measure protein [Eubacteriales bacterium]